MLLAFPIGVSIKAYPLTKKDFLYNIAFTADILPKIRIYPDRGFLIGIRLGIEYHF